MSEKKDERNVLMCLLADRPAPVRSKLSHCESCGRGVWVSPASLIAAGADARIVCLPCIQKEMEHLPPGDRLVLHHPSEGQLREIREWMNG